MQLGRLIPSDFAHVEKYPLTAATAPEAPVPVVVGSNWYSNFDQPVQETGTKRWWIGRSSDLGSIRGGHCFCLEPGKGKDAAGWREFYDQGREGACVGFGCSRMMSLLNRKRYDANWLYHKAQQVDEWPGESYEGTSVRAGLSVLKDFGHVLWHKDKVVSANAAEGISTYRWAQSVDEVHRVLRNPTADKLGAVPILNSWGLAWPERVWMPDEVLGRLMGEQGEVGLVTDR